MRRCPRCGYHLTRLAYTVRCDACDGLVPRPARKRMTLSRRIDPTGLKGEAIHQWLIENKGQDLELVSASGTICKVRYHKAPNLFAFGIEGQRYIEPRGPEDFRAWYVLA